MLTPGVELLAMTTMFCRLWLNSHLQLLASLPWLAPPLSPSLVRNLIDIFALSVFPAPDSPEITMAYLVLFSIIYLGFRDCCFAAGTEVRGGQTARNPWVLLGGCATSVLERNQFVMPNAAVPGDVLLCTKPLGTQVYHLNS